MYKHFIIVLLLSFISGCSTKNEPLSSSFSNQDLLEFKEIAWNDLSAAEKETLIVMKEEFKVEYAVISKKDEIWYYKNKDNNEFSFILTNPDIDYRNDQIFIIVTINTSEDELLGPIVVIIEPTVKQVFGRGTRE